LIQKVAFDLFRGNVFIFKLKNNLCHRTGRRCANA
jgi:hypothetical protein